MITRKLLLVFGIFFILTGTNSLFAQLPTNVLILNEYCVSNVPPNGFPDEKGDLSDYVELYCNHTQSINISGFWLSNDRNNLFKWKIPTNFPHLLPANYYLIWLSGKNTNDGVNFHTNFTIDQCKNQWIIISGPTGTVYDSVFVRPTMAGHVRGRVDMDVIGSQAWKLFTTKSPKFANGTPSADGYAPTPKMFLSTSTQTPGSVNAGEFASSGSQLLYMRLDGMAYDTLYSCYNIFYTTNGDYPRPVLTPDSATYYHRYTDSITPITLDKTTIVRAIAVPKNNSVQCPVRTLWSFCETNTYFIDQEHNNFTSDFGVVSIALSVPDTSWFNSQGAYSASIHVEYYDKKKQMSEGYAMITRPPQEEWLTAQKGFYIDKDDRLGSGCNFEGNVFNVDLLGTSQRTVFPALHLKAGDYESHSQDPAPTASGTNYGTGVRDIVMQSIAAKYDLHVSPLHIKPVVAFINGEYWGVYDLREIFDKYYEEFYNGQDRNKVDMNFVHNCLEASVSSWDGTSTSYSATSNFNTSVYNIAVTKGVMTLASDYNKVLASLDKESFIDWMILNSYGMNADLWCNNVALARGYDPTKPGSKWHFYLWNMPSAFNYTSVSPTGNFYANPGTQPCFLYNPVNNLLFYDPTPNKFNGMGNIMTRITKNPGFKADYLARYQDLLNGPLKCDVITKQMDDIMKLYSKEMKYHEDPASTPLPGKFPTTDATHIWDSNAVFLRNQIGLRCSYMTEAFGKENNCYGLQGEFGITVDVTPTGSGKVKLNTVVLDSYPWYGNFFGANITFKAIPSTNEYVFDHWEIKGPAPASTVALSMDSIVVNWNTGGSVLAVFTDKRNDIQQGVNIPTGFTPNGDGLNDDFKPLGSGEFATNYQMIVYNRWGQEVYRSVDPLLGWDGRFRGQEAQTGVYAYFITYKNIYNEDKLVKGNVTLTR